jgi:hypothetical protein
MAYILQVLSEMQTPLFLLSYIHCLKGSGARARLGSPRPRT